MFLLAQILRPRFISVSIRFISLSFFLFRLFPLLYRFYALIPWVYFECLGQGFVFVFLVLSTVKFLHLIAHFSFYHTFYSGYCMYLPVTTYYCPFSFEHAASEPSVSS